MSELDKDIADIKAGLESIGKVMANFSTYWIIKPFDELFTVN